MKKTRQILSIVLAVLFAFSSMPVVYTGTAAADAVAYAMEETGTLENPTRPIEASGSINETDLYKLNINSQSTSYIFYQTKNDEYFTYGQTQGLQNYYETDVGSRTLTFESIKFYEGASGMDGATEPKEISPGFGMWETPLITNNPTSEFLSKYYVSSQWKSTNSNAANVGSKPENFVLHGAWTDIGGCKVYTWQNDVIFKGNSSDVKGEINTGYYEQLFWNWYSSKSSARFDLRIGTTLRILDARELAKEIAEAEDVIANADEYPKEYVSSVEATLNTVPDDLRDFSVVYDQSEIDRYAQMLKDVSRNAADYTEFNQLYKNLKGINNSKGAYTEESFNAFKAEIAQINANLPKNLDKTKQATVDAATQALRDAFNKLVATDLSDINTSTSITVGGEDPTTYTVDNTAFKFMQTKDNQIFKYSQVWTVARGDGSSDRRFGGMILDTNTSCSDAGCADSSHLSNNGTSTFVSSLLLPVSPKSYTEHTAINEYGIYEGAAAITANEFNCWEEISDSSDILDSDGMLDKNRDYGFKENKSYTLKVSPTIQGRAEDDYTTPLSQNYILRTGYVYRTGAGIPIISPYKYTYAHVHIKTTVDITDVRQLISAVEEAKKTIAKPGTHSDNYIAALKAVVDSVPVEMLRGVEYFTQAEVDKFYNDITTIPENVADYSDFVETFEWMLAENKNKYTENSYNAFISEIYAINQNLPKNLTADQQSIIDEAVYALYAAHDKLVSSHLNDDNVITQEDIDGISDIDTNNPLAFTLSSTQYNFMQVADGQKFAIRTNLTVRNSKSRYTCQLLSLRFSAVTAETTGTICEGREKPDTGCHNGENVTLNQSDIVVANVEGVNIYDTINDAGDIAENNNWVNTKGVALSTNGILNDPTTLSTSDSSAYAEMYYTGPTGDHEANSGAVDVTFAYRLGWQYYEQVLGINGTTIKRHAHIPVNIKITDARALNSLYEESDAILKGKTDETYTFDSLVNLYEAFNKVDPDMAYGSEYFTQEQVNAAYADLKGAYSELVAGANYSEYFKAYVKAEEIMNTNNKDSRGNELYDEDVYKAFVETVTKIENELPKNLTGEKENQDRIDAATKNILDSITELEATKRADYSRLNDAMTEAEEIFAEESANPGTYTQETIDAIQNAYDNALQNAFNNDPDATHKELGADQQEIVDAAASSLEAAIADKEYKADYSEYEEAKGKADSITNNDGTYTDSAYQEYLDKIADIDSKLIKDLPDTAENRQTIADSTQALENAMAELENNKKADYTEFDKAVEELENIVENPDVYTEETVKAAEDALDKAKQNDDLTSDKQDIVDSITGEMNEVITNAKKNPADYTEYNNAKAKADAVIDSNNVDGNGNAIYDEAAFEQYKQAVENIDSTLPKDLTGDYQSTVNDATTALENLATTLENNKLCDYTKLDEAKDALQEIIDSPDVYTEETIKAAQDALEQVEQIPDNMVVGENNQNQTIIDNATSELESVIQNAQKNPADYTEYNDAKAKADAVIDSNNVDGNGNAIYDEAAFEQYKQAVENIDSTLPKDLTVDYQGTIDDATTALENLATTLESSKLCDYTKFDEAKDALQEIVDNSDNYTSATVEAAKKALEQVEQIPDNMVVGENNVNQDLIDTATDAMNEVLANKQEKANYTDYNEAKDAADNLVNDDGNGNPIYDEEAFQQYKDAVAEIDSALIKDLPKSEQSKVNDATEAIKDLRTELDASKGYEQKIIDPKTDDEDIKNEILEEIEQNQGYDSDEIIVEFRNYKGEELPSEDFVGTGSTMRVILKSTGELLDYKLFIVMGDVDGNGNVDADDYAKAKQIALKKKSYSEEENYFFIANDMDSDTVIDVLDATLIRRMY